MPTENFGFSLGLNHSHFSYYDNTALLLNMIL